MTRIKLLIQIYWRMFEANALGSGEQSVLLLADVNFMLRIASHRLAFTLAFLRDQLGISFQLEPQNQTEETRTEGIYMHDVKADRPPPKHLYACLRLTAEEAARYANTAKSFERKNRVHFCSLLIRYLVHFMRMGVRILEECWLTVLNAIHSPASGSLFYNVQQFLASQHPLGAVHSSNMGTSPSTGEAPSREPHNEHLLFTDPEFVRAVLTNDTPMVDAMLDHIVFVELSRKFPSGREKSPVLPAQVVDANMRVRDTQGDAHPTLGALSAQMESLTLGASNRLHALSPLFGRVRHFVHAGSGRLTLEDLREFYLHIMHVQRVLHACTGRNDTLLHVACNARTAKTGDSEDQQALQLGQVRDMVSWRWSLEADAASWPAQSPPPAPLGSRSPKVSAPHLATHRTTSLAAHNTPSLAAPYD